MSTKLTILLHGNITEEYQLESNNEYIIGRDESCDIALDRNYKKISRQHARLQEEQGIWKIELLSKHGKILIKGEKVTSAELELPCHFNIPPYEFKFEYYNENEEQDQEQPIDSQNSVPQENKMIAVPSESYDHSDSEEESTNPGFRNLSAILKVVHDDNPPEIFNLSEQKQSVGRGEKADIKINSTNMSRVHFQIYKDSNQNYWIKDLGSSNGTILNSSQLKPNQAQQLNSGDLIEVIDLKFFFEIRDLNFEQQLNLVQLDHLALNQKSLQLSPHGSQLPQLENQPKVIRVKEKPRQKKKNKKFLIISSLILILIAFFLSQPKKDGKTNQSSNKDQKEKVLSKEQKLALRDSKNLANSYRQQSKYKLCLEEIRKIHSTVPYFENSKEIEINCKHGHEMVLEKLQRERIANKRQEAEQQVQKFITKCTNFVKTGKRTVDEVQQCLSPVFDLDPGNGEAQALIDYVLNVNQSAKNQLLQKQELERKKARTRQAYLKAKSLYNRKKYKSALKEYYKFLSAGHYDPQNFKQKAKRDVASINSTIKSQVNSKISECQNLYNQQLYKKAVPLCNDALKIDPKNSKAKQLKKEMTVTLYNQSKEIFRNSILEEGMGNVERAKQMWKDILNIDLKSGDYYKKSKRKLRKYNSHN